MILSSADEIAPSSQPLSNEDFIHVACWVRRGCDDGSQQAVYK
jgi:hypothetical protein